MKKFFLFLFLINLQTISSQPLYQSEPTVRVRILNNTDTLKILFNDHWLMTSESISKQFLLEDGKAVFTIESNKIKLADSHGESFISDNELVLVSSNEDGTLTIKNIPFGVGWWWEGKEDRIYEGELHIYKT
ncbi:MAG: hypothetical protein HXY50_03040, partial [Ignavibacteriaceae bacterium]|nr:hypothetical protein [Ignavibacteriaceae bacterium]